MGALLGGLQTALEGVAVLVARQVHQVGPVVGWLVPVDAPVVIAIDDTLFHRSGRHVYGAFWAYVAEVRGQWNIAGTAGCCTFRANMSNIESVTWYIRAM